MEAFINSVNQNKNKYDNDNNNNNNLNISTTSSRPSRRAPKPPMNDGQITATTRKSTPPRGLRPGLEQLQRATRESPQQWESYNPIINTLTGGATVTSSLGQTGCGPGGTGLIPTGPCSPQATSNMNDIHVPIPGPSLNELSSVHQEDVSELFDNHQQFQSPSISNQIKINEILSNIVPSSQDSSHQVLQQAISSIPEGLSVKVALRHLIEKSQGIAEEQTLLMEKIEKQKSQKAHMDNLELITPTEENQHQQGNTSTKVTPPPRSCDASSQTPAEHSKPSEEVSIQKEKIIRRNTSPTPERERHSQIMNFSAGYATQEVTVVTTTLEPTVEGSQREEINNNIQHLKADQPGCAVFDATATTMETQSDKQTPEHNKTTQSQKTNHTSPRRWVSPGRLREFIPDSAGTIPPNLLDSLLPNDDSCLPITPPPVRWPESGQHLAKTRQVTKERLAKYRDIYWTRIKQNQQYTREQSPGGSPNRTPSKRTPSTKPAEEGGAASPVVKENTSAISAIRKQSSSTVNSSTSGGAADINLMLTNSQKQELLDDLSMKYITDELSKRRQVLTSTVKDLSQIVNSQRHHQDTDVVTPSRNVHDQLLWYEAARKNRRSESQKRGEGSPPTQEHLAKDLAQRLHEIHSVTPPKQIPVKRPMR